MIFIWGYLHNKFEVSSICLSREKITPLPLVLEKARSYRVNERTQELMFLLSLQPITTI